MTKIAEILYYLESICPVAYQESYDNCGLISGNAEQKIKGVLLCLDSTEEVINEAIALGYNLIIAHHPILFSPIKKLTGKTYSERALITAVKHDICIYAMHTNLDNIQTGVNLKIAEKLGLKNLNILCPKKGVLRKLVTFCPQSHADALRSAIFSAGAGTIGEYDECSFNASGIGTFRAGRKANPYVGTKSKRHSEKEERIETIYPTYLEEAVLKALLCSHPYEEVAYDIYSLENIHPKVGAGMTGHLPQPLKINEFLLHLKNAMKLSCIRYTAMPNKKIEKIAVCGGAGYFLLKDAVQAKADVLVTADFKYHQFFEAEQKIMIADIGHYESERYTPEIVYALLKGKFHTFAVQISRTNTNPVNYF